MLENTPKETVNLLSILYMAIGGIITFLTTYLVKRNDNSSAIKIAEINNDKEENEKLHADLKKALESIKNLKAELKVQHEKTAAIEQKFEAVKVAYRIIFKQYRKQFKNDPDSIVLLEELNSIINNE